MFAAASRRALGARRIAHAGRVLPFGVHVRLTSFSAARPSEAGPESVAKCPISTSSADAARAYAITQLPVLFNSWDDPFIVVMKPAGISVQLREDVPFLRGLEECRTAADRAARAAVLATFDPTKRADSHSVVSLARTIMGPQRSVYMIHRLDKHTSGALVLGLTGSAASELAGSLHDGAQLSVIMDDSADTSDIDAGLVSQTAQDRHARAKKVALRQMLRRGGAPWRKQYRIVSDLSPCLQRQLLSSSSPTPSTAAAPAAVHVPAASPLPHALSAIVSPHLGGTGLLAPSHASSTYASCGDAAGTTSTPTSPLLEAGTLATWTLRRPMMPPNLLARVPLVPIPDLRAIADTAGAGAGTDVHTDTGAQSVGAAQQHWRVSLTPEAARRALGGRVAAGDCAATRSLGYSRSLSPTPPPPPQPQARPQTQSEAEWHAEWESEWRPHHMAPWGHLNKGFALASASAVAGEADAAADADADETEADEAAAADNDAAQTQSAVITLPGLAVIAAPLPLAAPGAGTGPQLGTVPCLPVLMGVAPLASALVPRPLTVTGTSTDATTVALPTDAGVSGGAGAGAGAGLGAGAAVSPETWVGRQTVSDGCVRVDAPWSGYRFAFDSDVTVTVGTRVGETAGVGDSRGTSSAPANNNAPPPGLHTGVQAPPCPKHGSHRQQQLQGDAAAPPSQWRLGDYLGYATLPCGCMLPHRCAAAGADPADFAPPSPYGPAPGVVPVPAFALHPFVPEVTLFESAPEGAFAIECGPVSFTAKVPEALLTPGRPARAAAGESLSRLAPRPLMAAPARARRALTSFRLERVLPAAGAAVYTAQLGTGRTHQLRIHFADGGLPIRGDRYYNRGMVSKWRRTVDAAAARSRGAGVGGGTAGYAAESGSPGAAGHARDESESETYPAAALVAATNTPLLPHLHLQAYYLQFPLVRQSFAEAAAATAADAGLGSEAPLRGSESTAATASRLARSAPPRSSDALIRLSPALSAAPGAPLAGLSTDELIPAGAPPPAPHRVSARNVRRLLERRAFGTTLARVANALLLTERAGTAAGTVADAAVGTVAGAAVRTREPVLGLPSWLWVREPWLAAAHTAVAADAGAFIARQLPALRARGLLHWPAEVAADAEALLRALVEIDKAGTRVITNAFFVALHAAFDDSPLPTPAPTPVERKPGPVEHWWQRDDTAGDDLTPYETSALASVAPARAHPLGFLRVQRADGAGAAAAGARVWRFETQDGVRMVRIVLDAPKEWGPAFDAKHD